jgi:signal transduction histidine kinase
MSAHQDEIYTLQEELAHSQEELAHRERQIEAIRKTSDSLFAHPNVEEMVRATLKTALEVVRANAGTVFLYETATDSLVFTYVIGGGGDALIGQKIPRERGGVAWTVFTTCVSNLIGDVAQRKDFNADVDKKTGYQTQSMMTVPLRRTGGDAIGVMQVLNASVPFTPRDLEVLEVLCAQAGTGIEHAQLMEGRSRAEIGNRVGEIAHDIKNMMTPIESGVMTLLPMMEDMFKELETLNTPLPETHTTLPETHTTLPETHTTLPETHTTLPETLPREGVQKAVGGVEGVYDWLLADLLTAATRVRRRTQYIAGMVKGTLPPPVFESGDINTVVQDVVKTLTRTAREKEIALTASTTSLPPLAFDYDRLYDALYNLVNNALPETPAGGSVKVATMVLSPEAIQIAVTDTGRGIPEDVLAKLFTSQAVSTKVGGTGLGTSVAARVAAEHGGTIRVDSTVGVGSTFTITLPVALPEG